MNEEKKEKSRLYECKFCREEFDDFRQYGNHMKCFHPNRSEKYKKMKETWYKRKNERIAFKLAKQQYSNLFKGEKQSLTILRKLKFMYL